MGKWCRSKSLPTLRVNGLMRRGDRPMRGGIRTGDARVAQLVEVTNKNTKLRIAEDFRERHAVTQQPQQQPLRSKHLVILDPRVPPHIFGCTILCSPLVQVSDCTHHGLSVSHGERGAGGWGVLCYTNSTEDRVSTRQ